jgi:uncharacterized protein (TIRG00374 family)
MAAALIIFWIIRRNAGALPAALTDFNLRWLIPSVFFYLAHIGARALRWKILLDSQDAKISFGSAGALTMLGDFFSLIIPGGSMGGDAVKCAYIAAHQPRGGKFAGAFSILMDRWAGMISLFLMALAVAAVSFGRLSGLEAAAGAAFHIILFFSAAGLSSVFFLLFVDKITAWAPARSLLSLCDKYSGGAPSKIISALDSYRRRPAAVAGAVLVSVFLVNMSLAMTLFCLARGAQAEGLTLWSALLVMSVSEVSAICPLTPSGLGVRDYMMQSLLVAFDVAPGRALAAVLLLSCHIVFFCALGGVFFVTGPFGRKSGDRGGSL